VVTGNCAPLRVSLSFRMAVRHLAGQSLTALNQASRADEPDCSFNTVAKQGRHWFRYGRFLLRVECARDTARAAWLSPGDCHPDGVIAGARIIANTGSRPAQRVR